MAGKHSTETVSRGALIRGRLREGPAALRPPWALPEAAFLEGCTRCDACRAACPEGIVRRGTGGFPELDFAAGECTFCGDCLAACAPAALSRGRGRPWLARAAIGAGCLATRGVVCRLCEEACEPRAIRFRPRAGGTPTPELETEACTGCGACVGACPVEAIEITERTAA